MNRILLFLLCFTTTLTQAQFTWQQIGDFPATPRRGAACFVVGGYGYMAGGLLPGNIYTDETWRFDPVADQWSQVADLPVALAFAAGEAVNGKGYVVGGADAPSATAIKDDCWEYDPVSDSWTSRAPFPGMPTYVNMAFTVGNDMYVGLGNGGSATGPYSNELWKFDPVTGLWTQKADLPGQGRTRPSGCAWNGKGYVVGGRLQSGVSTDEVWEYEPVSDSWSALMDFPSSLESPAIMPHNGQLVIAGGHSGTGMLYDAYYYNTFSSGWSSITPYPGQSIYTSSHFSINGTAYVGFGWITTSGVYTNDFWKLTGSVVSMNELEHEHGIHVYPNPVQSGAQVKVSFEGNWSYRLFSQHGQLIQSDDDIRTDYFVLPELTKGIYLLEVQSENGQVRPTRLMVE